MAIESINPTTAEIIETFEEYSDEKVNEIIDSVHRAFLDWRTRPFNERSKLMKNAAEVLRKNKKTYGEIFTREMGKTFKQAVGEVEKCAWVCDYYAENTESMLEKEVIETDASESYVQFDPIGIVLAVMPWNFPFWQVFRFAAPGLMAGNVGVLKHASNVPQTALMLEEVFKEAGFPENVFRTLLISSSQVNNVLENKKVRAATLTGSEVAGKHIAKKSADELKKTVMELGGSDPFIIFQDADLGKAVDTAVTARLINNGQSCIAAKRFIVVEDIADKFEEMFVEKMKAVKIGDPMEESTQLGPIAREDLLYDLHEQVKLSVKKGANILCGGERLEQPGFYYPASVINNVSPGMPAYGEELFGPVASVIRAKDEEDAVRIANDTDFGLGASLWTSDKEKSKVLSRDIDSGSVFINGMVKSDPRLPFGGVKISGYGRELSHYGIKEFVNIKTVWIG